MSDDSVHFDDDLLIALAISAQRSAIAPSPSLRGALLSRIMETPVPKGFALHFDADEQWVPHVVPGIRMRVLAQNPTTGYATLLLDVAPGTRFPAHHHGGAEECYVVSGSLYTCGYQLRAGDFVHADADSDHAELWTEEGCRVILVAPAAEHLPSTGE